MIARVINIKNKNKQDYSRMTRMRLLNIIRHLELVRLVQPASVCFVAIFVYESSLESYIVDQEEKFYDSIQYAM